MSAPAIRVSRGIRNRLAKRRSQRVRSIVIDREGLVVDGHRIPGNSVHAETTVTRYLNAAMLDVRLLADRVEVRGPFKRGVVVTERWM